MSSKLHLFCLLFSVFFCGNNAYSESKLNILQVIPSGDNVENIDQIVIQFDRPVIMLGDSDARPDLSINIQPPVNCQWQWVNSDTTICYLKQGEKLHFATRYEIDIHNDFTTFDNIKLEKNQHFQFTTMRPEVVNNQIYSWKSSGKPIFRINFNQFVNIENLEKILYIKNSSKRYDINLLDEKKFLNSYQIEEEHKEFKKFFNAEISEKNNKQTIYFEPKEELPDGEEFKLMIDSGIISSHGSQSNLGSKELINFHSFDKPKFLGITCHIHNLKNELVEILIDDLHPENNKCLPSSIIGLMFSTPFYTADIFKYLKITPELPQDIKNNIYDYLAKNNNELGFQLNSEEKFVINLYGNFLANQKYNIQSSNIGGEQIINKIKNFFIKNKNVEIISDVFGRIFNQSIDFNFFTNHYEPQLFFPNYEDINVLEKSTDHDVIISSRNFSDLHIKYNVISKDLKSRNQEIDKKIDGKIDSFIKTSLNIRELTNNKAGLVFGQLIAKPNDSSYPESINNFMTQVTNFGIIAKLGHYNTLVYVTDLTTGQAINNAKVTILKSKFLEFNGMQSSVLAVGQTDEQGLIKLDGLESFDKNLKALTRYYDSDGLIIQVEKDNEMGWLPIRYNHLMSTWQINGINNVPQKKYGHLVSWGFTSQGVYHNEEEVKYKLYVRNNENNKLNNIEGITYNINIIDPTGKTIHEEKNITLSNFGSYDNKYTITKNARAGWYEIVLIPNLNEHGIVKEEYENDTKLIATKFLISDFTISPFKIRTELNKHEVFYKDELEISNFGELYSGGIYSNAPISVNIDIEPKVFIPTNPITQNFIFSDNDTKFTTRIAYENGMLDQRGEFIKKIQINNNQIPYGQIIIDSNIQNDNGRAISKRTTANYFGVDKFIGLKITDWFYKTNQQNPIQFIVTDYQGNLLKDIDTNIEIQYAATNIVQLRSAGDSYMPKTSTQWENITSCNTKSTNDISECSFTFSKAGNYRAIGSIRDSKNNESRSIIEFIVFDEKENIVWNQSSNETFEIIAEKPQYNIGEKARFMVKNPLIGANALITTERYGVIKQFTKKFDKSLEILEFDLEAEDAPGFYLSVVLTVPRFSSKEYENSPLVKPMAKIGYSKILVNDPENHLKINIATNKNNYRPAENVNLKISLDKNSQTNDAEVTILAIDEAVLDLVRGRLDYFNPKPIFSQLQALDVMNYSLFKTILTSNSRAMMKGADQGGDVGMDFSVRANFENLAFWKSSAILKKDEPKDFFFKLPDNLTSWRIITISNDRNNLFGLDSKIIKVSKETEIRPLIPNHILSGDKFEAGFSIFNRSDKTRKILFTANASGAIFNAEQYSKQITLEPFRRQVINFPISSQKNLKLDSEIIINATASDEFDNDAVEYKIKVIPAIIKENYFESKLIGGEEKSPIKVGNDAIGEFSSLSISLNKTIIDNLSNIFSFVKNYKFECWEQKLSKLFIASNSHYIPDLNWQDAKETIAKIIADFPNYQSDNGGMSYYLANDNYADPYLSATSLWVINRLNLSIPNNAKDKLKSYLESLLKHDIDNKNYNPQLIADTKALILDSLEPNSDNIMRCVDDFDKMSLFGKAKILNAAIKSNMNIQLITKWWESISNYITMDGANYVVFQKPHSESYQWLSHASKYTENCTILSTLLNLEDIIEDKASLHKITIGLANNIMNRNNNFSTHEAMLCSDAIIQYAVKNESSNNSWEETVNIKVKANNEKVIEQNLIIPSHFELNDLTQLIDKDSEIIISPSNTENNIYYNSKLSLAKLINFNDGVHHGIGITRYYELAVNNDKFEKIINFDQVNNGDMIKVSLKIDVPGDRHFVVVEDYIPGCFEPIDQNLETSLKIPDTTQNFYFYHKDLKKNYARFYADFLPRGEYAINYFVQVISKGNFTILPSFGMEMYNEDTYGKTKAEQIVIR